ncbi:hypothetical protein NADE_008425 [Nannochloris sp. 'desiccata']|nr:hypothetical protein NADE_002790 [Chlorella desiccata (nom. nud.)]KAH7623598.1 hypothetical protein NADE_008425 [Chlorella desiccata (nom. nud.)]
MTDNSALSPGINVLTHQLFDFPVRRSNPSLWFSLDSKPVETLFGVTAVISIPGLITSSLLILLQPGLQTGHGAVITGHVAIVDV